MRQSSGTGRRQMIGASVAPSPRPPSTTSPPREKSPMPIPERAPRPRRNASPATSCGRLWRLRKPAATASASCVPEPRPAWAGTTSETLMRCPPRSDSNRSIFCKCCETRSASGPEASLCARSFDRQAGSQTADRKSDTAKATAKASVEIKKAEMQPCRNCHGNGARL